MSNTASIFTPASVLGLIFITLKLTGHIAWSWLWVLAPLWIPVALGITVLAGYFAVLGAVFLGSLLLALCIKK